MKKLLTIIFIATVASSFLYLFFQIYRVGLSFTWHNEEQGSFLKETGSFLFKSRFAPRAPRDLFVEEFSATSSLEESGVMSDSQDIDWWVNSGGRLVTRDRLGKTIQNSLSAKDRWSQIYASSNPVDTDNGKHPQNIFRLVQRDRWDNLVQQAYFRINRLNLSQSPNRNASNGLFLFNRYQTGDNLYYIGLRVDGGVVIKKKIDGIYYTMAYKKIFDGRYDLENNPNLLPLQTWIGLRGEIVNNPNNTVSINVYTDIGTGWSLALQAVDDGINYGPPIINAGYAGIRTDFMDVEFQNYWIRKI